MTVAEQHRRAAGAALGVGPAQAQLLGQQFVEGDAPPRRVLAVLEVEQRDLRRRLVQEMQADVERGEFQVVADAVGQGVTEILTGQRAHDQPAQGCLADTGGGRVDGRQAIGQRLPFGQDVEARMDQFVAEEAATHFAEHTQALADRQGLLLARIEVQEAQDQRAAAILDADDQLAPRPEGDFTGDDRHFELRRLHILRRHVLDLVVIAADAGAIDGANATNDTTSTINTTNFVSA